MPTYGYARVSTDGQSLGAQHAQLHAAGCVKVYAEKISGARSNRPELAKMLKRLDKSPEDLQDLSIEFIEAVEKMCAEKPDDLMAECNVLVQRFVDTGLKRLKDKS